MNVLFASRIGAGCELQETSAGWVWRATQWGIKGTQAWLYPAKIRKKEQSEPTSPWVTTLLDVNTELWKQKDSFFGFPKLL